MMSLTFETLCLNKLLSCIYPIDYNDVVCTKYTIKGTLYTAQCTLYRAHCVASSGCYIRLQLTYGQVTYNVNLSYLYISHVN